jgi:hypothetical protein
MTFYHFKIAVLAGFFCCALFSQTHGQVQGPVHDLKHIAEKPFIAIWSRPQEHLANPALGNLFAESMKMVTEQEMNFGKLLGKIDGIRICVIPERTGKFKGAPRTARVIHFSEAKAARSYFEIRSRDGFELKKIPGMEHEVYAWAEKNWEYFTCNSLLDPQTYVWADNLEAFRAVTATKIPDPNWKQDLERVSKSSTVILVDLLQVREHAQVYLQEHGPFEEYESIIYSSLKPIWENAEYAFFTCDTTKGILLAGQIQSSNAEAASTEKKAVEALAELLKSFLPMAKPLVAQLNDKKPELGDAIYRDLETSLNQIKVTQDNTKIKLTISLDQDALDRLINGAKVLFK